MISTNRASPVANLRRVRDFMTVSGDHLRAALSGRLDQRDSQAMIEGL